MTANAPARPPLPVRGVPGGYRDWWDDPIDHAALREQGQALERRQEAFAAVDGPRWQAELTAERLAQQRERNHRNRAERERNSRGAAR